MMEFVRDMTEKVGKPVREGDEQLARNPRARSAIMRVAERSAVAWDAAP